MQGVCGGDNPYLFVSLPGNAKGILRLDDATMRGRLENEQSAAKLQ